jgi:hypothetical protein
VFEALAVGAVPVVIDFGGPGDIVHQKLGCKVPLSNENEVVSGIEKILTDFAGNRDLLNLLRQQGMSYARECLTWDAKAHSTTRVLNWAARRGPKPNLPPPKILAPGAREPSSKLGVQESVSCAPSHSDVREGKSATSEPAPPMVCSTRTNK